MGRIARFVLPAQRLLGSARPGDFRHDHALVLREAAMLAVAATALGLVGARVTRGLLGA